MLHPVLINGQWIVSTGSESFQPQNPATQKSLPGVFPVSPWQDIDAAIDAAVEACQQMRNWPGSRFADFLEAYAAAIEDRADELISAAHLETALPLSPRLKDVELPRTTNQLRQAAAAARTEAWREVTIHPSMGIRSMRGPIGPAVVFGPNNFPFAFNAIAGGDFAAAIAAGNPVIAKGHSSHPETTRLSAEAAMAAIHATEMPSALVQLIYRTGHEDGFRLVSDARIGAIGYTGARATGQKLKAAADATGRPIYLELSSINPVFILGGALAARSAEIIDEFAGSCLMGTGQFCTNPGLVVLPDTGEGRKFAEAVAARFDAQRPGTLLSEGVHASLTRSLTVLQDAGAAVMTRGQSEGGTGVSHANTLLTIDGSAFLEQPATFQTEAFGNSSLFVFATDSDHMLQIASRLEGNLTGCIYSDPDGGDDSDYDRLEPVLRTRVGRLLNDKMPTGVAVSPAMNHGGPWPATSHPGFTAVGLPASIQRFTALYCYDNVRPHRLPALLQDASPGDNIWRRINGTWTTGDVVTS